MWVRLGKKGGKRLQKRLRKNHTPLGEEVEDTGFKTRREALPIIGRVLKGSNIGKIRVRKKGGK